MKTDIGMGPAACVCVALAMAAGFLLPAERTEAATAPAQRIAGDYPAKPIRIVDPFAAGGSTDYMARLIGQKITERHGQPVIVDNRPGAAGNSAAEMVARALPDGYTLFMGVVSALAPAVTLYPTLGYDVMKDFAHVTLLAAGSYVLVVSPTLPAKSVAELIAVAKSRPGQISYGSSGVGGPLHLAGELLKSRAGVDILHVPYKGAAPVMAAVAAGEVQVGFASVAGALPLVRAGRVTAVAVTSAKRAKPLPELPTIAESGFAGFDVTPWYGLLAPVATPPAIVKGLNAEIARILQLPDVQEKFQAQGLDATPSTPERFRQVIQADIEQSAKVIRAAGIKPE
jgi:tripartite-type tricarboxylate transporter receptor subunit TctC